MSDSLLDKSVFVRTLGCQMNVFDGEVVSDILQKRGCRLCGSVEEADIVIFVTCSVRAHAEDKVYSLIGKVAKIKKENSGTPLLGIAGCTAQKLGSTYLKKFSCIDFVVGTHALDKIAEIIEQVLEKGIPVVKTDPKDKYVLDYVPLGKKRAYFSYVPVSRGCSRHCTYCIVPHVRGGMTSRAPRVIADHIKTLYENGCREVTLLGQNIDAYGKDIGYSRGFAGLLEEITKAADLERLNFVTSHPADFSTDILYVIRDNPAISPFLHLPPQSGSNSVLKRMKRGYTRAYYLDLVEKIYSVLPHAEIAGDFIVGFPGETEHDFMESVELLHKVQFQQAYIFKYSPREYTYAAGNFQDDVPLEEKKRRNAELLDVQEEIQLQKNRQFLGEKVEIIVEGLSKKNKKRYFGRTSTNYRVVYESENEVPGEVVSVKVHSVTPLTLFGEKV